MSYSNQFEHYLMHEKRFSQHTVIAYMNDIDQFKDILCIQDEKEFLGLVHRDLRGYLVSMVESGLENSSINRKLSSVKTFFKYLRQQGLLEINPAQKIRSLKQKKVLPQFVPESQLWTKEIFQEEKTEYEALQIELILELFYQTGIRLSELIHLEMKNVSATQIKVLGKRNKERIIPIANKLNSLIEQFCQCKTDLGLNSQLLIVTNTGEKLSPKFVYNKVNYYLGKATNLSKKSPHVLRHTFATHMLNNGASLESIKKLLGHTDLAATQIYTHNSFKQIKSIYKQTHPRGAS